jgi:hypothetical protein
MLCSNSNIAYREQLLQLRVLGFGLYQDGDVGVGVFPSGLKREH